MRLFCLEVKRVLKSRRTLILIAVALVMSVVMAYLPIAFESINRPNPDGTKTELDGMVFGVDHCRCIMREERLQELLQRVQAMPFESLEKMELYIREKLSGAFPKISFQEKEGQEAFVDMGVAAFMKKGLGVAIQYETDSQQHQP